MGSSEHGHKLATKAFVGDRSALHWDLADQDEHEGRANLFKGAFLAHRNPRADRVLERNIHQELAELLLLNLLFGMEKSAVPRENTLELATTVDSAKSLTHCLHIALKR